MPLNPKAPSAPLLASEVAVAITVSFMFMAPLLTFVLLAVGGFPPFASGHLGKVLVWVYEVTWLPALLSGGLISATVLAVMRRTAYFHRPYDIGRCISLGAIAGALAEALATILYRRVSSWPFSIYWIAGAMIAGCLAGAVIVSVVLRRVSRAGPRI